VFLGAGTYGQARPDVATMFGDARFTSSGFTFTAHVPPGPSVINVYARKAGTTTVWNAGTVAVTVAPANPQMALETPPTPGATLSQPFTMSGWAIDAGTSGGTGVASMLILAYPNPGSGTPPIDLGNATYGISKPYVQQAYQDFGTGFTNSGFQKEVRGLAPGVYRLVAQALSTVTGTYNQFREITVTVTANPVMWVDIPGTSTSVNQYFTIAGWAADLAAASGTGVNTLHIWAYQNPGSGQAPIWVGTPTYGSARSDIAGLYGSQFTNSGFSIAANLPPGVYLLYIAAFSTVTNSFNQAQHVTVTVATSQLVIAIDQPASSSTVAQPFGIAGWAIDLGAPVQHGLPGVDRVHIHAIASGEAGAAPAARGPSAARRRGASASGGGAPRALRFGRSSAKRARIIRGPTSAPITEHGSPTAAYGLTASGLAPGYYQINEYAHSTVLGLWPVQTFFVTVE
jgi:hypothetical protein